MSQDQRNQKLYSLQQAGEALGGVSSWTLRAHIARGSIKTVRIGRRVFLSEKTVQQISERGLSSLTQPEE